MMRNKKAQGVIYGMLMLIVFLIIWMVGLGSMVTGTVGTFVDIGGLTGFTAFFFDYLSLWITMILLIAIAALGVSANA